MKWIKLPHLNLAGLKNLDIPLTTSEVCYGPVKLSCSSCHILKKKPVRDGHPINAHSSISSHDVYFIVLFWKKKPYVMSLWETSLMTCILFLCTVNMLPPRNCEEYFDSGKREPGMYLIDPDGYYGETEPYRTYCNFAGKLRKGHYLN